MRFEVKTSRYRGEMKQMNKSSNESKNQRRSTFIGLEKSYLPKAILRVLGVSPNKQKRCHNTMLAIYTGWGICISAKMIRFSLIFGGKYGD